MLLSVCIPTHQGRAANLARAMSSVLDQLTPELVDEVEVCVSDNASADGSDRVVADRRDNSSARVVYHRNPRDLGLVANLLQSVQIASGRFCWLLGSDDTITDGGLDRVIGLLREHPDIAGATVNRVRIDYREPGVRRSDPHDELPADPESVHLYTSTDDIFVNVGLSQDFMSTQVLERRLWSEVLADTSQDQLDRVGDLAHLLLLGRMAQRRSLWLWCPDPLVHHRTGTSALDERLGHRYALFQLAVMEGRSRVWAILFGKRSQLYKRLMTKAYLRSARPSALIGLKLSQQHDAAIDLRLLTGMIGYFYWLPRFWLASFPVLLVPHGAMKLLSKIKRAMIDR